MSPEPHYVTSRPGVALVEWPADLSDDFRRAINIVGQVLDEALTEHGRAEAWIAPDDVASQRVATWSGMRREGVVRGGHFDGTRFSDRVLFGRLADDPRVTEPLGFRAMLNSFLPRKRAIGQMLVRDPADRVLLCQLTYKKDWDLPGGVVEVGESPHLGVTREIQEELSVNIPAGQLLLTDWLPEWSGWDDALCLVYDGGVQKPGLVDRVVPDAREIRSVEFCDPIQVRERCRDFTVRRVESALAAVTEGPSFAVSGRPTPPPSHGST